MRRGHQIVAQNGRRSRVRRRQGREHPHQRGLAGAVRAENGEYDAARNIEIEAVDGAHIAKLLDQAARNDGGRRVLLRPRQRVGTRYVIHVDIPSGDFLASIGGANVAKGASRACRP